MPYKDKEAQKNYWRDKKRQQRTSTPEIVQPETLQNVHPEMFEGKPRFLTLSDGQVLDRMNQPKATKRLPGMEAANRAYSGIIRGENGESPILDALVDPIKRDKLERICQSLKNFNQLSEVRYGVQGPTFDIVSEMLDATS